MPDQILEIKCAKMLLVLFESELLQALQTKPDILMKALKRGKSSARAIKEQGRKPPGGMPHEQ